MTTTNNPKGTLLWEYNFALCTFFEIETEAIEHLVPKTLTPVEVVPGLSLFSLIAFNFPAGALGTLPEFQELILSLIVTPDLSRGVPKSAMYIVSLGSTCQEHLDHCISYYKLPVYGRFTRATIEHETHTVKYENDDGPILTMKNIHPNPKFSDGELYFQSFVKDAGDTYVSDIVMKGNLFEHQQAGKAGRLWPHPFFRGIDPDEAELVTFLQMLNEPGSLGQQSYPQPEKFSL